MQVEELAQMRGQAVFDNSGAQIGSVEEIFVDEQTRKPEWVGIGTGFFGTKRVLVPVEGASPGDGGISVPYSKDQVKDAPDIDSDEISQETEQALYSYYGLGYSEQRSDTGLPEGDQGGQPTGEQSVTRSEEELRVGKQTVSAGTVRLRKYVETEPVSMDVELQRETARVVSEPVNQPVSDAEIGEQEIEVPLTAEQAVVDKQTVAKERVAVETQVETERETVSDELRRERVELEGEQR